MRLISRAGVIILCLSSFIRTMFTRAKSSVTDSFAPFSRVSNSLFVLSYATSSVSSAIIDSARHASEGEPISNTIFMVSVFFLEPSLVIAIPVVTFVPTCDSVFFRVRRAEFHKFLRSRQSQVPSRILLHKPMYKNVVEHR